MPTPGDARRKVQLFLVLTFARTLEGRHWNNDGVVEGVPEPGKPALRPSPSTMSPQAEIRPDPPMTNSSSIRWPAEFEPSRCAVYVSNQSELAVPPERVWEWLIRATLWPRWYSNAKRVRILEGSPSELALGTRFHWWTFKTPITSQVLEFQPNERLAWDAKGPGVFAYHAWLITPTPTGCHVLTEECQHGLLARLHGLLMPHDMHDKHQIWLDGLKDSCHGGRA
ncbi:MAG TPA: SRPBCC domain-containing protein [Thermoanaerobaculia bacterium]|nr:SRPBCC domain-containing protein [Thermoanaerobaculia bacterium]